MRPEENSEYGQALTGYLRARVSRAQALKAGFAGVAAAVALPAAANASTTGTGPTYGSAGGTGLSFPSVPQVPGVYTPESVGAIANIAITAEFLAVTFLTAALGNKTLNLASNPLILAVVQAALTEEVYHADALASLGAKPLTTNFSVPDPAMLTDQKTFFSTLEVAESIFIGAYLAATREFAEQNQPFLVTAAAEIMGVEAEHRALARAALAILGNANDVPPNNKAFESSLFVYVRDAAAVLSDLGFLGNGAIKASYPGRDAALAAAGPMVGRVIQTGPNYPHTSVTAKGDLTGNAP